MKPLSSTGERHQAFVMGSVPIRERVLSTTSSPSCSSKFSTRASRVAPAVALSRLLPMAAFTVAERRHSSARSATAEVELATAAAEEEEEPAAVEVRAVAMVAVAAPAAMVVEVALVVQAEICPNSSPGGAYRPLGSSWT